MIDIFEKGLPKDLQRYSRRKKAKLELDDSLTFNKLADAVEKERLVTMGDHVEQIPDPITPTINYIMEELEELDINAISQESTGNSRLNQAKGFCEFCKKSGHTPKFCREKRKVERDKKIQNFRRRGRRRRAICRKRKTKIS